MSDLPWLRLIERLRQEIPRLVSEFLEILEDLEGYDASQISDDELERTAQRAFRLFVDRLAGTGYDEASVDFTDSLGRARARQGLRFDHFMNGVRINFRILWRGLERAARQDLNNVLITNGERVLDVVERYATEVQRSFADEQEKIKRQHENTRDRMIRKIFSGPLSDAELDEVATVLSICKTADYELLALPEQHYHHELTTYLRHAGVFIFADHRILYAFRRHRNDSSWPEEIPDLVGGYIAKVPGLASMHSAADIAQRLSSLLSEIQMITIRDGLLSLLAEELTDQLKLFHHDLVGGFRDLPLHEQGRLFETLKVFMTNGSMQKTAEALYVHRNTVFKRLKRFEEVTGLDITIPRDAAVAMVTLDTVT